MERKTIKYHLRSHKNCFYGEALVEVVMKATNWSRDNTNEFCKRLLDDGLLLNVSHHTSNKFKDGKDRLYRLAILPRSSAPAPIAFEPTPVVVPAQPPKESKEKPKEKEKEKDPRNKEREKKPVEASEEKSESSRTTESEVPRKRSVSTREKTKRSAFSLIITFYLFLLI